MNNEAEVLEKIRSYCALMSVHIDLVVDEMEKANRDSKLYYLGMKKAYSIILNFIKTDKFE